MHAYSLAVFQRFVFTFHYEPTAKELCSWNKLKQVIITAMAPKLLIYRKVMGHGITIMSGTCTKVITSA